MASYGTHTGGNRPTAGDAWGALAATAIVLPQAMAFGVTLFAPIGVASSMGALAGLVSAALLCLASGLARGTVGLISAPTGPTLVLLGGAVATLLGQGVEGAQLLTAVAAILVLAGLFQALLGLSGGGRLIKFIPYPVVYGFITGSAILMVMSQWKPIQGVGFDPAWSDYRWIPAVTALVTLVAMLWLPKVFSKIPGPVSGLVVGTLLFHGLALLGPGSVPQGWVIGGLPALSDWKPSWSLELFAGLPWVTVAASALALSILASLDTLLTAVVADVATGTRHDARRELLGQGVGHAVLGLLGGMSGAGTTGATVVAIRSGGGRWAGAVTGVAFIVVILFLAPVTALLPISTLAGIILGVAIGSMLKPDMIQWMRRRRTRLDGGVALLVTLITVAYDLMVAVGFGVGVAILQFVRLQIQAPVVHRRMTAAERPSMRRRTASQRALIEEHGGRIVHYALRGTLFFGTADKLVEELGDDLDGANWVILDMGRVSQVDLTAVRILDQMAGRLRDNGGQLIVANLHKEAGIGRKAGKAMKKINPKGEGARVLTFIDADEALEYAEGQLLEVLGDEEVKAAGRAIELRDHPLCAELTPEQVATLEKLLQRIEVPTGEKVFTAGEDQDSFYWVVQGEVDAILPTTSHHHRRLATFGPGTFFGEVAFLDPGPRTADVVATQASVLYSLGRKGFDAFHQAHPNGANALLLALSRELGQHLRWADREIRMLALR